MNVGLSCQAIWDRILPASKWEIHMQCDTRYMYSTSTAVEIQDSPCPSQCTHNMTLYVQVYPLKVILCVCFAVHCVSMNCSWQAGLQSRDVLL